MLSLTFPSAVHNRLPSAHRRAHRCSLSPFASHGGLQTNSLLSACTPTRKQRNPSCCATPCSVSATSAVTVTSTSTPPAFSHNDVTQRLLRTARFAAICSAGFFAWAACATTFGSTSSAAPFATMSALSIGEASSSSMLAVKSAFAGTAAGFLHTLCGPDHLAALTPLTIGRNRGSATFLGALWGFGHSTGQLILGLIFVLLKDRFHEFLPFLDKWAGTVVGLTLIAIGLLGLYETLLEGHHAEHEEEATVKLAYAGGEGAMAQPKSQGKMGLATYATGIVYGLQPDALFVVIPALALPTKLAAAAYCSCFVVGTVAAMAGYTFLIGTTSQALIKDRPWLASHLSTAASGVAILVGSLILAASFGIALPFA